MGALALHAHVHRGGPNPNPNPNPNPDPNPDQVRMRCTLLWIEEARVAALSAEEREAEVQGRYVGDIGEM